MMRIPLQQVTLVAIDTQLPALAAEALLRSMAHVDCSRALLFTHGWLPARFVPGLEVIDIDPFQGPADRSHFVLKLLPSYVRSSHALLVQWDAFVSDSSAWSHEFLTHDYVGAVWPDQPEGGNVGSGGFSLRSRRMLQAGRDPRLTQTHPEDEVLCRIERQRLEADHGLTYAKPRLAKRFAHGAEVSRAPAFGFNGVQHLPRVLDERTLLRWLSLLPDDFFGGPSALVLARALLVQRMPAALRALLQRRRAFGPMPAKLRLMGAAASLLGLLSRSDP
jgi:hypothetical protein